MLFLARCKNVLLLPENYEDDINFSLMRYMSVIKSTYLEITEEELLLSYQKQFFSCFVFNLNNSSKE